MASRSRRDGAPRAALAVGFSVLLLLLADVSAFAQPRSRRWAFLPARSATRTARGVIVAGKDHRRRPTASPTAIASGKDDTGDENARGGDDSPVEEYRNAVTSILSNFMQTTDMEKATTAAEDPLADIDFDAPKFGKVDLETLAGVLDFELYEREWFVTGNVNPSYFSDDFQFQDPDVKVSGIEDYARGVYKLFDQETSRAEIISTVVNSTVPNTITCTWRLSGKVKIGPGLTIKPYICYTDFTIDESSGLITFQEDRFDIPGWDILLSSLFPFLIGKVLSDPAPPMEDRVVAMPTEAMRQQGKGDEGSPLDKLFSLFGNMYI